MDGVRAILEADHKVIDIAYQSGFAPQQRQGRRCCACSGPSPSESIGAATHWCSRLSLAAKDCADRRSRSERQSQPAAGACWLNSAPWSQVNDRRSCSGRVVIVRVMASRTAPAPCPASAGPFLTRAPGPWPSMGGRCSSIVNRVVRSTRVPMAELWTPRIRSPSQCPGTARSSASAGRLLIITSGLMKALPRPRARARGTRSARPVRRHAVNSCPSPPRPYTYSAW